MMGLRNLLAVFSIALGVSISQVAAQQKVELELVLAMDTSTSVNEDEFILQRDGLAQAFLHPQVLAAIKGLGAEGMAVTVVQWAGSAQQTVAVDWMHLNDENSVDRFAAEIRSMQRRMSGFTDIANAISFSVNQINNNGFDGRRLAIDVSGDGSSGQNDPRNARDSAILQGMTINGLVIHTIEHDLGDLARYELQTHYLEKVIGGPGAFMLNAESFEDFAQSMREKLYREISGPLFALND